MTAKEQLLDAPHPLAGKWRSIGLLAFAEVLVLALWFSASAVIPAWRAEYAISDLQASMIASSVAVGFVIGTLISAVLGLADRFDPRREDAWPHAGTFNNNVLTMNAGLTGLTEIYTADKAESFNARGDVLRQSLNALADKHGASLQFTGRGSMMAVHFRRGEIRNVADAMEGRNELRPLLHMDLVAQGIYPAARGMFTLSLAHTEDSFAALEAAVEEFLVSRNSLLGA